MGESQVYNFEKHLSTPDMKWWEYDIDAVYSSLKTVLPEQPIQQPSGPLANVLPPPPDRRWDLKPRCNYGWELYKTPEGIAFLEYWSTWTGLKRERSEKFTALSDDQEILRVKLTLHPSQKNLQERINIALRQQQTVQSQ